MRTAATVAPKTIEINVKPQLAQIQIVGTSPLLVNRFGERPRTAMRDTQAGKPALKKAARDPESEYLDARYLSEDGKHCFPASGFKNALVSAGGRYTDLKMTVLRGLVRIPAEFIEIVAPEPVMREDNVRLASGVASLAYRPVYDPWEATIPVRFISSLISLDHVINLLKLAGETIGVGAWRPELDGPFGTFRIKGDEE